MSIPNLTTFTEAFSNKLFEISSTMPNTWDISEKELPKNTVDIATCNGAVKSLETLIGQCPSEDQQKLLTTLKKIQRKLEFNQRLVQWLSSFSAQKQKEFEEGLEQSSKTRDQLYSPKMEDPRLQRMREKLAGIFLQLGTQIHQAQWKDHPELMHKIMRHCEQLATFSEHVGQSVFPSCSVRRLYPISSFHTNLQKTLKGCLKAMISQLGPYACDPLLPPPRMSASPFLSCSQNALLELYKEKYPENTLHVLEMGRQKTSINFLVKVLDTRTCGHNPINLAFSPKRLFNLIQEAHCQTLEVDDLISSKYSFFDCLLGSNFKPLPRLESLFQNPYYYWLPPLPSEERMSATLTAVIYAKNQSGFQRQGVFIHFGERVNGTEETTHNPENDFRIAPKKTSEHLALCIDEENILYLFNPYGDTDLQEGEQQPNLVILGDDPASAAKYLCRIIKKLHRDDHKGLNISPVCHPNTCFDIMSSVWKKDYPPEYAYNEAYAFGFMFDAMTFTQKSKIMEDTNPVFQLDRIPPVPDYRNPHIIEISALYQLKPTQNLGVCCHPHWGQRPISFTLCDGVWKGKIPLNKDWKFVILENDKVTHWEQRNNRNCKDSTESFTVQSHEMKF